MEVLFHGIFELIKISILSSIYAAVTLLVFKIVGHLKAGSWFEKVSKKKLRLWFLSGFFISVALVIFMVTYWGDHGLGDSAKVPIGHFKTVKQINGVDAFIENRNGEQLEIKDFTFDDKNLYGQIQKEFNGDKGDYVVWNLRTDEWKFYKSEEEYLKAASHNNYPRPEKFEDFGNFYSRHWNGIRFWLLP
jgi:hypothetical protein